MEGEKSMAGLDSVCPTYLINCAHESKSNGPRESRDVALKKIEPGID